MGDQQRRGGGHSGARPSSPAAAVLVPIKAFSRAKARLSPALSPTERAQLARSMAARVVAAAGALPVAVACDDAEVAAWATQRSAAVIWTEGLSLDAAVGAGVAALAAGGFDRVVVTHADLPLAAGLDRLAVDEGVVLVPDPARDGTPVVSIPSRCRFRFSYGPGSFGRHCREAARLGLPLHVADIPELGRDVDVPTDLLATTPVTR